MKKTGWLALSLLMAGGTAELWGQVKPNRDVQERKEPLFRQEDRGKKKDKDEDANTRAVGGVVRNEADDPVEGAIVQLKDTKSLRVRSYITKADGQYRFYGLSQNVDYELRADYQDMTSDTKTLSVFDNRKQAVINLKLEKKK
jgi:hypothetical protein